MVNACYFVQSHLVVTAVRDSGRYSWLCVVYSTSTQQRAVRAAANPFSVSINVAVSRASLLHSRGQCVLLLIRSVSL
jgi:hypothetical protein